MNSRIWLWALAIVSVLLLVVPLLGLLGIGGTLIPSSMAGGVSGTALAALWILLVAAVIVAVVMIAARGPRKTSLITAARVRE